MTVIRINGSSTGFQPQAADISGDLGLSDLSNYNMGGPILGQALHGISNLTYITLDNPHADNRNILLKVNDANQHQLIVEGTNTNYAAQRRTEIGFKQRDSSDTQIFQGILGFRHRTSGADEFRLAHLSDDGSTPSNILQNIQNSSTIISNGHGVDLLSLTETKLLAQKRLDIEAVESEPHALFISTDMTGQTDDLHNSMTCFLDYTGSTLSSVTKQNSVTFSLEDDSGSYTVGKFNAEYNADGLDNTNKMKLIAVDNGSGSNGQIDVSPQRGQINVPWKLASYTTTERDALPGIANGVTIYNETTHKFQGYANGAWVDLH